MNRGIHNLDHERFEELGVLSLSGELTQEESAVLEEHLGQCTDCQRTLSEYEGFTSRAMAGLASQITEPPSVEHEAGDDREARQELFRRIDAIGKVKATSAPGDLSITKRAAFALALLVLGVSTAVIGFRGTIREQQKETEFVSANEALASRLGTLLTERQGLDKELGQRSRRVEELEGKVRGLARELDQLQRLEQALQDQAASHLTEDQERAAKFNAVSQERDGLAAHLATTENSLRDLNRELTALREERQKDQLRRVSLEAEVEDLGSRLRQQNQTVEEQRSFLASDRDIRELMGARQLYIADVFDVSSDSRTRKPYGRVFYTKGKSLIFYAFDLDRQPHLREASTFQVWGKNESAQDRPVKLGVLYIDSEENRRWALRCDDPRQLAEIDSVFVTVEPNVRTDKPTGKPFLVASLRKEPNHP